MFSVQNEVVQDPHTDVCGILKFVRILVGGVNVSYSYILSLSDDCHVWKFLLKSNKQKKLDHLDY